MKGLMEDSYVSVLKEMSQNRIPLPEYLTTIIKDVNWDEEIIMSWPTKKVIIFSQDVSDLILETCRSTGILAFRIFEIDFISIKERLS